MVGGWWREKGGLELLEKEIGGNSRLDVERCGGVICPCLVKAVGWVVFGLDWGWIAHCVLWMSLFFFIFLTTCLYQGAEKVLCCIIQFTQLSLHQQFGSCPTHEIVIVILHLP